MIDLTQLIFRKKNAITKDECQFLIEEYDKLKNSFQLEQCPDANSGILTQSTFKRTCLEFGTEGWNVAFKANENLINEYMDYLDNFKMFHKLIRESMLYSHMYRLLKYEPGTKIHPHTDHDPFVYGSATFNLNDNYTGGDFLFWNGAHRVKLEAGEGMIWPADYFWVHEVEPIQTGVRYSTNSFLLSIPDKLKQDVCYQVGRVSEDPNFKKYANDYRYNIPIK